MFGTMLIIHHFEMIIDHRLQDKLCECFFMRIYSQETISIIPRQRLGERCGF